MVRSAVPPVSDTGPSSFRIPVSAIAIIPARYQSSRLPGKALADIAGRPMIEHVYRRAAAAALGLARDRRDRRPRGSSTRSSAFGGDAVMTSASHQSGTDRLAEVAASLDCDVDRQRPGGRAAARAGDDRRRRRAVRRRSRARDEHAAPPHRRRRGAAEPERHQGRRRSRRLRAVFLARADPVHARRASRAAPAWAHIGLYVYRRATLLRAGRAAADRDGARRGARAAARARARHPDQGDRNHSRHDRRRHAAKISRACARCSRTPISHLRDHNQMQQSETAARQVHPRHRRRRVLARQGPGGGLDRRASRGPRLQGRAPEVRPLHQRRSRAR